MSKKISPEEGLNKFTIILAIVDFPLPLSPTKPKDSPSFIANETSLTAITEFLELSVKKLSSKLLLRFFISTKSWFIISFFDHLFNILILFSFLLLFSFSTITNLEIFLLVGGTELTKLLV